jgi:hypothetical protein
MNRGSNKRVDGCLDIGSSDDGCYCLGTVVQEWHRVGSGQNFGYTRRGGIVVRSIIVKKTCEKLNEDDGD